MTEMKEVARLRFQYMLVTCEVAEDGLTGMVRCVNVGFQPDGVPDPMWAETVDLSPTGDHGNPLYHLYSLFKERCDRALSLYTRSEWHDSLSGAGVNI